MKHHAAFGLGVEDLDIVVVDDSKPMQTLIRSILLSFRVARVRAFDSVDEALQSMMAEPPNVILTDWRMGPTSGYQFLRLIRHRHMEPLCYVPLMFITAHGTRALVNKALRAGAHHLLVKPLSPSTLYSRLRWLVQDARQMILEHSGFYNVSGINEAMNAQAEKLQSLHQARVHTLANGEQFDEVRSRLANAMLSGRTIRASMRPLPKPPVTKDDAAGQVVLAHGGGRVRRPVFAAVNSKAKN
ncbi:hypothetical protein GCM10011316_14510 [Roseibium aquae]|uniref:Response regulatory domain-containing protein n=1 Tax=Roseibium aquae TaxID=1323746 RepID=A0A916TH74_9HYPH|nr:response regulator [Roseibium aquae]GGB43595.1 hypothetical protein GCM10011316_14510 [Roseibium aquae]